MGKMLERKCRNCGNVYKFESSASFIVFCPYCKRFDYLESEYISPVTECTVFMDDEIIGAVKAYSDDNCEYDDDVAYDKEIYPQTVECSDLNILTGQLMKMISDELR